MNMLSFCKTIFNLDYLVHAAKAVFLHVRGIYRPSSLSLKHIFSWNITRSDVPAQMLTMAKKFDLSDDDIAQPNWRATWIVENCNSCWAGKHCFKDSNGAWTEDPGFNEKLCPNYEFYHSIEIEKKVKKKIEENAKEW